RPARLSSTPHRFLIKGCLCSHLIAFPRVPPTPRPGQGRLITVLLGGRPAARQDHGGGVGMSEPVDAAPAAGLTPGPWRSAPMAVRHMRWTLGAVACGVVAAVAAGAWFAFLRPAPGDPRSLPFWECATEAGLTWQMHFLPNEQGETFKINLYDHGCGLAVGD